MVYVLYRVMLSIWCWAKDRTWLKEYEAVVLYRLCDYGLWHGILSHGMASDGAGLDPGI